MNIDMLSNGMDSLKRGFSSYHEFSAAVKDKEQPSLEDYFILKQAVLSTHHGVEILLKHILNQKSEFLIVDEMDAIYKSAYKEKIENNYQSVFQTSKHRLTRAHREKQLKMSCQALHNAPPNRT